MITYSMLTTAIPDMEILAERLFTVYVCNVFARWHQRVWFKRWEIWRRVSVEGWRLRNRVPEGTFYSFVQTLLLSVGLSFMHNAQRHRRADGLTDRQTTYDSIMPIADPILRAHAVRSAKNCSLVAS